MAVMHMWGGGGGGGLVWRIVLLGKRTNTKQLDYMALVINYLKKSRVGGFIYGIYGYSYFKHLI